MTEYVCEKCIHRYPKGGCLVPSNLGYVEQCKHFTEESKPKPMTNEEYLHTLNTEQLADVLADVSLWIHPFMKQKNRFELLKKQFYEWLKQQHKE